MGDELDDEHYGLGDKVLFVHFLCFDGVAVLGDVSDVLIKLDKVYCNSDDV